jgi:hypothetical protein
VKFPYSFLLAINTIITFIFVCPETNPKGQPFICPPEADYWHTKLPMIDTLLCSQRTGDIGKSLTLHRVAYPLFAALLGCVKWPIKHFITKNNAKSLIGSFLNFPSFILHLYTPF